MALVDKLRDEIIESQKAQASFTRWKLFLVAGFGAASIGVLPNTHISLSTLLVLSFLPFVCLYVDTLCYHSGLRVLSIARYLRCEAELPHKPPPDGATDYNLHDLVIARDYERFCHRHRDQYALEGIALLWVSRIVSLTVAIIGVGVLVAPLLGLPPYPPAVAIEVRWALTVLLVSSGLVGSITASSFYRSHQRKAELLDTDAVQGVAA